VVGGRDLQAQFLQPARNADRPGPVAEVPFELADDRGNGEVAEIDAPLGLEPVHGLDHADDGHLDQIVGGLTAPGVAARQPARQR